jgi:peroxiredoxin
MIRRIATAAAILFFAQTALAAPTAPDFTLKNLSGKSFTLSSYRGKSPVLLAFGATWCPYCRNQVPKLIELRKNFKEQDLAIFGVDIQEDRATVAAFGASKGINYEVLLDTNNKAASLYGVSGIPFFILIDRAGNVVLTDYSVSRGLIKKIKTLIV